LTLGVAFVVATGLHYWLVSQWVLPSDKVSAGWFWLQGPKAFLNDMVSLTMLRLLPMTIAGPLAIAPLLGWAVMADKRPLIVFLAYAAIFCIVGRENNYYWGFLVLPAYLMGLAYVPRAIVRWSRALVGNDGNLNNRLAGSAPEGQFAPTNIANVEVHRPNASALLTRRSAE